MTKFHTLLISVGLVSLLSMAGCVYKPAFAAPIPANGLSVSPPITNIQVAPNQSSTFINEVVTNPTGNELSVSISARDFGALNASGSIGFYGSSYQPSTNQHSLSSSLVVPTAPILIGPHQTETVNILIANLTKLSAGGHYSALLFTPSVTHLNTGTNQVSLQPSVASLVFVTTASGGFQSIKLAGLSIPRVVFNLPETLNTTLSDTGNTQLVPRGVVKLIGSKSKLISQEILNPDSGLILPGTSSLFSSPLTTHKDLFRLPGIYHIQLTYFIAGSATSQTVTKSFIYINPIDFIYLGGVLLIIWLSIEIPKKLKSKPNKKKRSKRKKPVKIKVEQLD
jgi:hypothetical protein